ncbi:hypothetical protein E4Z66_05695 [Aliishimia ponticola]|uniref:Uncharacterized protein n=1 Tax=Aliishimia ponticola TaxID=2499833 RepID=A0A4S4NL66_9RHOB|nr:hypothetical protein [Aliishimia ponticola]THH39051.1 hypothetical protein E4Z66_05695 [Aliishimia ponticola]
MRASSLLLAICLLPAVLMSVWIAPARGQEMISPESFLDIAEGRTLTFHSFPGNRLVGTEQFLSRSLSVWKTREYGCVYGRIWVEDRQICFLYEDIDAVPDCWNVFRMDDRLLVRTPEAFGAQVQEVTEISDTPVGCPETPIS